MLLSGKALEEFDKWYLNQIRKRDDIGERYFDHSLLNFFWNSGETMINAFVIEWLDSVGIYVLITCFDGDDWWCEFNGLGYSILGPTRQQATEQAIIKANEIYNERYENTSSGKS